MILSIFASFVGFVGNISAVKKSKYATLTYGITLLLVLKFYYSSFTYVVQILLNFDKLLLCGAEVVVGCCIYFKFESLAEYINSDLLASQTSSSTIHRESWDRIKQQFNCCLIHQNISVRTPST